MTEREKMLAGELYDPTDRELCELRRCARLLTEQYNASSVVRSAQRAALLKKLFGSVGEIITIEPSFHCDYGGNIYVGENFYANYDCVILDVAEVRIGNNCLIGPQVGIYTATHPVKASERYNGLELGRPVTVGDNCWIGGHATINPGVTIGSDSVIASGTVVVKDVPQGVVVGGNPARVLKVI